MDENKIELIDESVQAEEAYQEIRGYLIEAQNRAKAAINSSMVEAYWRTGKKVYEVCGNNPRAEYGKRLLSKVSEKLVGEFGKGFGTSNLCNMRKFYLTYQKCDTLCSKLIWSQYRLLMRVQDELKRELNLDDFQKLEEESNF